MNLPKKLLILAAPIALVGPAGSRELEFAAAESNASGHGRFALEASTAAITSGDLRRYVSRLASTEYEGRGTGDRGERMATAYLATFFEGLGLTPAGDADGGYYQNFAFNAGKSLTGQNSLAIELAEPLGLVRTLEPGTHYLPVSFSPSGKVDSAPAVFAGFGIQAKDYDSFEGLEIDGKWVIVLRGSPKDRKELLRFGPLVAKAQIAKKLGAAGIVFIKGPNPAIGTELVPLEVGVGARGEILPAISITDRFASTLLTGASAGDNFQSLFEGYHEGNRVNGFPLPYQIGAEIALNNAERKGRNVVARLTVSDEPTAEAIVIGGHIDHIGYGNRGGSRASGDDADKLHLGADDNASGVAAIMELAQFYADKKRAGQLELKRDLVFAAWSGEEMGLHGSSHYVKHLKGDGGGDATIFPATATYINLDMVGRLGDKPLNVQGTASSGQWKAVLDSLGGDLETKRSPSPYIPTDSAPFYASGVPILALFTGLHDDYHTPADTVEKIDFEGLEKISGYLQSLTAAAANLEAAPAYVKVPRGRGPQPKVMIGIRSEDVADKGGVRVVEVIAGSPAEKAGIEAEDILNQLDGKKVANLQGLLRILTKLEADKEYAAQVKRGEEQVELTLVPAKR